MGIHLPVQQRHIFNLDGGKYIFESKQPRAMATGALELLEVEVKVEVKVEVIGICVRSLQYRKTWCRRPPPMFRAALGPL